MKKAPFNLKKNTPFDLKVLRSRLAAKKRKYAGESINKYMEFLGVEEKILQEFQSTMTEKVRRPVEFSVSCNLNSLFERILGLLSKTESIPPPTLARQMVPSWLLLPSKQELGLIIVNGILVAITLRGITFVFNEVKSRVPRIWEDKKRRSFELGIGGAMEEIIKQASDSRSLFERLSTLDYEKYVDQLSFSGQEFCLSSPEVRIWNLLYFQNFEPAKFAEYFELFVVAFAFPVDTPLFTPEERKEKQTRFATESLLKFRGGCQENSEMNSGQPDPNEKVIAKDAQTWKKFRELFTSVTAYLKTVVQSCALFLLYNLGVRVMLRMARLKSFNLLTLMSCVIISLQSFWSDFWSLQRESPPIILFTGDKINETGFLMFSAQLLYKCVGNCSTAFIEAFNAPEKVFNSTVRMEFLGKVIAILDPIILSAFHENNALFPETTNKTETKNEDQAPQ